MGLAAPCMAAATHGCMKVCVHGRPTHYQVLRGTVKVLEGATQVQSNYHLLTIYIYQPLGLADMTK